MDEGKYYFDINAKKPLRSLLLLIINLTFYASL